MNSRMILSLVVKLIPYRKMVFLSSMRLHTSNAQYFKVSGLPWTGALPTAAAGPGCLPEVRRSRLMCWMLASSLRKPAFSSVRVGEAKGESTLMETKA